MSSQKKGKTIRNSLFKRIRATIKTKSWISDQVGCFKRLNKFCIGMDGDFGKWFGGK